MESSYIAILVFSLMSSFTGTILGVIQLCLQMFFVSWIDIDNLNPDSPEVYEWVMFYMSRMVDEGRVYSITCDAETASSLAKIWYDPSSTDPSDIVQVRFIPGTSWGAIYDNGLIIFKSVHTVTTGGGSSPSIHKMISFYTLFPIFTSNIWPKFIIKIKNDYEHMTSNYQQIYKNDREWWGGPILVNTSIIGDGVFSPTREMEDLIDDIRIFLSPLTMASYKKKGLNYCKRICVHGIPGTGKTNLAVRIAGEFGLPIYNLNCQNLTDGDLSRAFDSVQR